LQKKYSSIYHPDRINIGGDIRRSACGMRKRKLNRKRGYDYSGVGAYFVTVCVKNMNRAFGKIHNGIMVLNEWGLIADSYWHEIPTHYRNIRLDEWIIMPDHIHGIIWIGESEYNGRMREEYSSIPASAGESEYNGHVRTEHCSVRTAIAVKNQIPMEGKIHYGQLSKIIKSFKNAVIKKYRERGNPDFNWHRSYHDRIIRSETELNRMRGYIKNNPLNPVYGQNIVLSVPFHSRYK
jgi:putative transposase